MERLTCYFDNETAVPRGCCTFDRESNTEPDDCISCGEMCEEKDGECRECPIQKAFNKLAEYEVLDEQGLLLQLPCKVGETIFVIIQREIYKLELKDYRRNHFIGGLDLYCINTKDKYDYRWIWNKNPNIFITQEQAKQALKEMEKDPKKGVAQ